MMDSSAYVTAGLGVALAGVGLYVRLTLGNFIVEKLNGRYPTTAVIDQKFETVGAKIDALHDALSQLPCKTGHVCQGSHGHADISGIRETMDHMTKELIALKSEVARATPPSSL